MLFGQVPSHEVDDGDDPETSTSKGNNHYIMSTLTHLLRKENMVDLLPKVLKDVRFNFEALSEQSAGVMNPFDSIYQLIAQVTTRTFGCDEIADDPSKLKSVLSAYTAFDSSTTPMSVMYPRFPTPAVVRRFIAGAKLYKIVSDVASERQKSGQRGDDPLQYLIDQGFGMDKIVGFIVGALAAGMVNTGLSSSWTLCYLASNPDWMAQVREEVDAALVKYATGPEKTTLDRLCSLPLAAWQSDFPKLYLCIRETLRIHMHGAAIRANFTGKDIPIGKEIIPNESFAVRICSPFPGKAHQENHDTKIGLDVPPRRHSF